MKRSRPGRSKENPRGQRLSSSPRDHKAAVKLSLRRLHTDLELHEDGFAAVAGSVVAPRLHIDAIGYETNAAVTEQGVRATQVDARDRTGSYIAGIVLLEPVDFVLNPVIRRTRGVRAAVSAFFHPAVATLTGKRADVLEGIERPAAIDFADHRDVGRA